MSTTISGNINDLTGTAVSSNCYVRFWLRGCNGNQPRVGGSALLAPDKGPTYFQDFVPTAGAISGTLFSNDVNISAGGQTGVTWYGVQVFFNGIGGAETPYSLADGVTFNLNSATPISTAPVVAAPTGDSTYLRLDGGNSTSALTAVKKLNNVRFADQFATLNLAIADLPAGGGIVRLSPNTTYTVTAAISIANAGIVIQGSGFSSNISVNHTSDVFQVSAALFRLEDCEVTIATTSSRSAVSIINANSASAQQGCVNNVRFTGSAGNSNNGNIFFTATPGVGLWMFDKIRIPGGVTWNTLASLSSSTGTTVASMQFSNIVGSAPWAVAGFLLDGSIDTVQLSNLDIPGQAGSGPIIWCRNTVSAPINPRWIHCSNVAVECSGGTAVTLDAVRDFKYDSSYVATCTTGFSIGANALMVTIADSLFTNIGQSAITVASGALHTIIHHNDFEDTCNSVTNSFDTISVAANVTHISILGNIFRTTGANLPAHFVNISGTSDNYFVVDNDFTGSTGTSAITNTASGSNRIVFGNMPNGSISNSVNNATAMNSTVTFNGAATFNVGVAVANVTFSQNSANGGQWIEGNNSELLTLSTSGATTDTAANLLPANSIIEAVVARVTTTITTATDWKLGDATQAARFTNANATLVSGTTTVGLNQADPTVATANLGPVQTSAAKVRVTTTGTPGAGVIRITVFYRQFTAPSS